jgi:hypothetical protein
MTSMSSNRYRTMAEAKASGIRLRGTADSSIGNDGSTPSAYGSAYPTANVPAPSAVPQAIQRS